MRRATATIVALALLPLPAAAENLGWNYRLSLYGWFLDTKADLGTPVGSFSTELSFSDALKDLEGAFMGTFEARNGPWSVTADYLYFNIATSTDTPRGLLFSSVDNDIKTNALTGILTYAVYSDPSVVVDVGGGFRWFSVSSDATLQPGLAARRTFNVEESWTDPVLAARARFRISDKWVSSVYADYGGFQEDNNTWQALATFGYEVSDRWTLAAGYRYMHFEHQVENVDLSIDQSGPMVGATFQF